MRPTLARFLVVCTVVAAVLGAVPAQAATRPSKPTLTVADGAAGTYLTWTASGADRFHIQQATDARFTRDVRTYTDRDGRDRRFTPAYLTTGGTYWFRVRGARGSVTGSFSAAVKATVAHRFQPLTVMTYNVLRRAKDGTAAGGTLVAPWSKRAPGVADHIAQSGADLVAIQEASDWVAERLGPRQVDDLVTRLGGRYALAGTELVPGTPGWFRTGRYILYRPTVYEPVGAGGHWSIGPSRWAAYQVFRHRTTGADLLFVSFHLTSGGGRAVDVAREAEMRTLMRAARTFAAAAGGVPVVYAGDANSHDGSNHVYDGPGTAARAGKIADAFKVAVKRVDAHVNSANKYLRTPPTTGRSVDRVFTAAGVAVRGWRVAFNDVRGRFVGVIPSDHHPLLVSLSVPY